MAIALNKEEAFYRVKQAPESIPGLRGNLLREYLQGGILQGLEEGGFFKGHAFMGGCALRFLYRHPRFSEDLNFASTRKGFYRFSEDLDFERTGAKSMKDYAAKVIRKLEMAGFEVEGNAHEKGAVERVQIKFPGILKEAGLSKMASEKLTVLLESDSNPPDHAVVESSFVQSPLPVALRHHDIETLMAGKLAALVLRPFVKSRDWYDWLWYRNKPEGEVIEPNLDYLQGAIDTFAQSSGTDPWSAEDWPVKLRARIEDNAFPDDLSGEIRKFLERPEDAVVMTKENFLAALENESSQKL